MWLNDCFNLYLGTGFRFSFSYNCHAKLINELILKTNNNLKIYFICALISFFILPLAGISQNVTSDKDSFAILPPINSKNWGGGSYFKPSQAELKKTDIIFKECTLKNRLIHSRYKRQYIPYLSKNGSKHIKIICFCEDFGNNNWKKNILSVLDGGNCFFEVIINLSTNTYSQLRINGEA